MSEQTPGVRYAEIEQETNMTRIRVVIDLDGLSLMKPAVDTGVGMFDYLLSLFAKAGKLEIGVSAEGDLSVDDQNIVREVGVCIGKALRLAIGAADGIRGVGSATVPVEDVLVLSAVEFAGRSHLNTNISFTNERLGGLSTECIQEFFRAVTVNSGMTVHIRQMEGTNNHHLAEAAFRSFGHALQFALSRTE